MTILGAFLVSCVVGVAIGAFNGTLVAKFNVQSDGRDAHTVYRGEIRSIPDRRQAISHTGERPDEPDRQRNTGNPHTNADNPDRRFLIILFAVLLKTTNLKLYSQCVGINQKAARLNGINPVRIKFLTYMILGVCTAVAGFIAVTKAGPP